MMRIASFVLVSCTVTACISEPDPPPIDLSDQSAFGGHDVSSNSLLDAGAESWAPGVPVPAHDAGASGSGGAPERGKAAPVVPPKFTKM